MDAETPETPGIPCPHCDRSENRVLRTRPQRGYIARRRECTECGYRFTTTERLPGSGDGAGATSDALLHESIAQFLESLRMTGFPSSLGPDINLQPRTGERHERDDPDHRH